MSSEYIGQGQIIDKEQFYEAYALSITRKEPEKIGGMRNILFDRITPSMIKHLNCFSFCHHFSTTFVCRSLFSKLNILPRVTIVVLTGIQSDFEKNYAFNIIFLCLVLFYLISLKFKQASLIIDNYKENQYFLTVPKYHFVVYALSGGSSV